VSVTPALDLGPVVGVLALEDPELAAGLQHGCDVALEGCHLAVPVADALLHLRHLLDLVLEDQHELLELLEVQDGHERVEHVRVDHFRVVVFELVRDQLKIQLESLFFALFVNQGVHQLDLLVMDVGPL